MLFLSSERFSPSIHLSYLWKTWPRVQGVGGPATACSRRFQSVSERHMSVSVSQTFAFHSSLLWVDSRNGNATHGCNGSSGETRYSKSVPKRRLEGGVKREPEARRTSLANRREQYKQAVAEPPPGSIAAWARAEPKWQRALPVSGLPCWLLFLQRRRYLLPAQLKTILPTTSLGRPICVPENVLWKL
jgi:hypothetical protein